MITVSEAEYIILAHLKDYGVEAVPFDLSLNRVLAEDIVCDRDLPPYNRATMDGIAISFAAYEAGLRTFRIKATQAAGDTPIEISDADECIEIMTGAALPGTTDTVVRYEDLDIQNGIAAITTDAVNKNQSIHFKGVDKKQNEVVAHKNQFITPSIVNIAASVGKTVLVVKKLPRVVLITTGNELVEVSEKPTDQQVRRSNNYAIKATLQEYGIKADMLHLPDEKNIIEDKIADFIKTHDVILLSGGISKGKFDYVPEVLESLSVSKLFHGVAQRPGKPFWFGAHDGGSLVFAFPGNPVSTFMCLHRYFLPWLSACLGMEETKIVAVLAADFTFKPSLQYFLQVKLAIDNKGVLTAMPVEGNGSGDFANLLLSNAFMELPAENNNFKKGEVYRVWPFNKTIF